MKLEVIKDMADCNCPDGQGRKELEEKLALTELRVQQAERKVQILTEALQELHQAIGTMFNHSVRSAQFINQVMQDGNNNL